MARGGKREGAGRKKGIPNKLIADVRQAILEALQHAGGVEYLASLAKTDPRAFCTLLAKTLPVRLEGDEENPPRITIAVDRPPNETREQWLERKQRELALSCQVKG